MEQFTPCVSPAQLNLLSHSLYVSKYWLYYGFVMLNTPVIPFYQFFTGCSDLLFVWCFSLWCKLYECIYSASLVVLFFPSLLYSLFSLSMQCANRFIGVHAYRQRLSVYLFCCVLSYIIRVYRLCVLRQYISVNVLVDRLRKRV